MKQRSTTPVSKTLGFKSMIIACATVMAIAGPLSMSHYAFADKYDDQIRAVQREIEAFQAKASELSNKAKTLQNEVDRLSNEKATIQAQIDLGQAKYDKLVADIAANEKKIAENQEVLGKTIADLYVDDNISPLEMLASSSNIGDYLDKQTQRSAIRDTLTKTIETIKKLKKELEQQKIDVEHILDDQKNQRAVLSAKEAEQQNLLNQTKGEEAAYKTQSAEAESKKLQLQRQQQAEIQAALRAAGNTGSAVAGDPSKGGYPKVWANADYYNPPTDSWGMYALQCVSYVAWKVYQKNGYMPYWGGRGNANQWPGNARGANIGTGSTPRAGAAGVISSGQYGHIVWVESVNGDGTINISQYNEFNAGGSGWGNYSERYNVRPGTYDTYIYF
jgi:surface antigen